MISGLSITFMFISTIAAFMIPIAAFIYFRKTHRISFKPVLIGILCFILFAEILEQILHYFVITNKIFTSALAFALYGSFAAGIFEETGRFIMYKAFLRENSQWKDGVAFGIGHGGIEAILVGGLAMINPIIYSFMINAGTINQLSSRLTPNTLESIKNSLMGPSYLFLFSGIERLFAFTIQISLSILVLYAVKNRKSIYLLLAIFLHALIDFPAGLYQTKIIKSIPAVEACILIFAIIAFIGIVKSKKAFLKNGENRNAALF